ncbi:MAG: peroxiredoxin [Streptococcaceae bacterium]|jgi:peroxiredoxin (alkyl hydroperoxide reductase subunit C)|nr:peroxiredoxin [Streptococcaceae bacterium]
MSLIGKKVEFLETDAFQTGEFLKVSSEDLLGKWAIVMFYPADFSFVCPTELEDLQEQYDALSSLGVEVYSVSTDTHFVHAAWHEHSEAINKLTYAMLADPSGRISRSFDVLDEVSGLAQRGTFIIDPQGVVQATEVTSDGIGRDASQLLDKVKAAQYVAKNPGEVCPAKWKEGEQTLTPGLDLVGKI